MGQNGEVGLVVVLTRLIAQFELMVHPLLNLRFKRAFVMVTLYRPYFFIIAMEALHVTFLKSREDNIFQGIQVGKNKVCMSHLQFADDALIIGEWSLDNATNLFRILRCFHLYSK